MGIKSYIIIAALLVLLILFMVVIIYIVEKQKKIEKFSIDSIFKSAFGFAKGIFVKNDDKPKDKPKKPKPKPDPKSQSKVILSPPPLITNFSSSSYTDMNINTKTDTDTPCSVYYTSLVNECDEGIFNMKDIELEKYYGANTESYNTIMNEIKKLPEAGICKVTLQNWKLGSNVPILNFTDTTNTNRGNPSSWAYCFRKVTDDNDFSQLTTNLQSNKTLVLNPNSLSNVFNDGQNYTRVAFNNFNYSDIKSDVCSNINIYGDETVINNLFGLTIDNSSIIRDIGIYSYSNQKIKLDSSIQVKEQLYEKLFEEILQEDIKRKGYASLIIQPKETNAYIYRFDNDACGYNTLQGTIPGTISLKDFGINIKTLNAPLKETDDVYGTLEDMNERVQKLTNEMQTLETSRETETSRTAQKRTDITIAKYTQRISRINHALDMIERNKKVIIRRNMVSIIGRKLPYNIITTESVANGLSPIYKSNDNRIYLQII